MCPLVSWQTIQTHCFDGVSHLSIVSIQKCLQIRAERQEHTAPRSKLALCSVKLWALRKRKHPSPRHKIGVADCAQSCPTHTHKHASTKHTHTHTQTGQHHTHTHTSTNKHTKHKRKKTQQHRNAQHSNQLPLEFMRVCADTVLVAKSLILPGRCGSVIVPRL